MTQTPFSRFGEITQLAFVPRDIDAALHFWTKTIGVGPFFKFSHIDHQCFRYKGQSQSIDLAIYIGYLGNMQIELIQQLDNAPSTYQHWLKSGREGLHHVCLCVDDLAPIRKHCDQIGANVEQEFLMTGVEAIYVDSGAAAGTMIEFAVLSSDLRGAFEHMRRAADNWDGSDPVRSIGGSP